MDIMLAKAIATVGIWIAWAWSCKHLGLVGLFTVAFAYIATEAIWNT